MTPTAQLQQGELLNLFIAHLGRGFPALEDEIVSHSRLDRAMLVFLGLAS